MVMIRQPQHYNTLRPQQREFLDCAPLVYEAGKKVLFAELPTGAGKSLIGTALATALNLPCVYCCGVTKDLQRQVAGDYPEAGLLFGRANYATLNYPERYNPGGGGLSAADCDGVRDTPCSWCRDKDLCPYKIAKGHAVEDDLAILNFDTWLSIQNLADGVFERELVVLDEADMLEEALKNHISLEIPSMHLERWGYSAPNPEVPQSWGLWLEGLVEILKRSLEVDPGRDYLNGLRAARAVKMLLMKIMKFMPEVLEGGWVVTSDGKPGEPVKFQPVMVDKYAQQYCWRHGGKFLLMSGTMGDPKVLANSLGLKEEDWWMLQCESTFPAANRPIYVWPAASLNYLNEPEQFARILRRVELICKHHEGQNGLIHTVSGKRTKRVVEYLQGRGFGDRILQYESGNSDAREKTLAHFKANSGLILVAQSMERGINLPYKECEFQISVKTPFPDLTNRMVKARRAMPGGDDWFGDETARRFGQMAGRINRHEDDIAASYFLDGTVENVIKYNYIPQYIREAIVMGPPSWAT